MRPVYTEKVVNFGNKECAAVSKMCAICGKKPIVGSRISHAHNVTKRRFNPNLQRVRALRDGQTQTLVVCCACIKSGRIQKAP